MEVEILHKGEVKFEAIARGLRFIHRRGLPGGLRLRQGGG